MSEGESIDLTGVDPARRAETLRRIDIVRRYLRIEQPTMAQEAAFAAEIGLQVDMFRRVVSAWKTYQRAAAIPGARGAGARAPREERSAARLAAEGPIDLTGVWPHRRAETVRRIRSVGQFLAIEEPTSADRAKFASALGISAGQFNKLVRQWVIHRKASAIPGASAATRSPAKRDFSPAPYEAIMREAVETLGASAPGPVLRAHVAAACAAAAIPEPSKSTLYNYRRAALRQEASGPDELLLDHVTVEIPVGSKLNLLLPVASLLIHRPSSRILAWTLSLSAPTTQAAALLLRDHVMRAPPGDPAALRIAGSDDEAWQDLRIASRAAGAVVAQVRKGTSSFSTLAIRTLGRAIGPLKLRAKARARPGSSEAADRTALAEAQAIFAEAVTRHNDACARQPERQALVRTRAQAERLASALAAIAAVP